MLQYLIQNQDITSFSGYRTKAISKYFFELKNSEDLEKIPEIKDFAKKENLKILFLGWWMNSFFAFDIFDGIIIKNSLKWFDIIDWVLEVNSWENVIFLVSKIQKDFWIDNFKPWSSLPGTVGGAIVWNAWCFWLEVSDLLISAKLFDLENNTIIEVAKDFLGLEYRNSRLKKDKRYFIISAKFEILKNIENFYSEDFRFKNQPKGFNCWSVFKNPTNDSAGKLIDSAELKWTKIWWAEISEIHANFIVNTWEASYKDILELKNLCQKVVFEKYWIELEEEINIIAN